MVLFNIMKSMTASFAVILKIKCYHKEKTPFCYMYDQLIYKITIKAGQSYKQLINFTS